MQDDTATRLAKEHGVSPKTIRRDAAFAAAVEKLPEVATAIAAGEPIVKSAFIEVAKTIDMPPAPAPTDSPPPLRSRSNRRKHPAPSAPGSTRGPSPVRLHPGPMRRVSVLPIRIVAARAVLWLRR